METRITELVSLLNQYAKEYYQLIDQVYRMPNMTSSIYR